MLPGVLALSAAIVLLALPVLARPPAPDGAPRVVATATAASTATPTPDRDVPAACAADIRGPSFARGSLDERVSAARSWAAGSRGQTASVVVTDAVLTESVRAQLAGPGAAPFLDPAVGIRPDGIRVSGTATASFLRFPISAVLRPSVSAGTLTFTVTDLETGGLPAAFRPRVNELLAQAADPAAWRLPLRVESFTLRAGCAVLVGVA